jgi:hypothetical protein
VWADFSASVKKTWPFHIEAVRVTKKSNDWYLVMDATKDGLKNAQDYEYNNTTTTWVRAKK